MATPGSQMDRRDKEMTWLCESVFDATQWRRMAKRITSCRQFVLHTEKLDDLGNKVDA